MADARAWQGDISGGQSCHAEFPDLACSEVSTTRTTSCPQLAHAPFKITAPFRSSPE
jgi:hypothetical protein